MLRILRRGALAVVVISFACVLLLALVWVSFPQLAPGVAGALLDRRGIELERLDIRRPSRHGIHVAQLELRARDDRFALRARRLALSWQSVRSLLREGPEQLVADTVDIDLAPATDGAPGTAPMVDAAWLGELPLARLSVRHLHLMLPLGAAPERLTATGSLELSRREGRFEGMLRNARLPAPLLLAATIDTRNQVHAEVRASNLAPPLLELDGRLTGAAGFAGRAHASVDAFAGWLDAAGEPPQGELELEFSAELTPVPTLTLAPDSAARIRLDRQGHGIAVALSAPAPVTFTLDDQGRIASTDRLALHLSASAADTSMEGYFQILAPRMTLTGDLDARVDGEGALAWRDSSASYATTLQLDASLAQRELEIASGSRVVFATLRHAEFALAAVSVAAAEAVRIDATGNLLAAAELDVTVDDPDRLTLDAGLSLLPNLDTNVAVRTGELRLAGNDALTAMLPAAMTLRSGGVTFSGQVQRSHAGGRLAGSLSARWSGVGADLAGARLRGASGNAAFTLDHHQLAVTALTARFDQLAWRPEAAGSPEVTVQRGGLSAAGSLALDPAPWRVASWAIDASLEADVIAREELRGRRLSAALRAEGAPQRPSLAGRARLDLADVGIPVADIDCRFAFDSGGPIDLEDCSASMLGGELRLPRGTLDPASGDGYLPIAITGVDLGAMLALMQDPALGGQGTLDGSVPLRLLGWRPIVEEGRLAARTPGGTLAYATPSHVVAGIEQPALRLALRAVRDLRYQRLSSRVDYGADGTLAFGVDLLGSNPEIEGGRPIQLNLNVTQNLLELLRSLQLSAQLERDVERRLQRIQQ